MNNTELIAAARQSAFIGDASAFTDYTDAQVLLELTDKLWSTFGDIVTKSTGDGYGGYWLKETIFQTTANRARYRIPARAAVGGLYKVEAAMSATGPWVKLPEESASVAQNFEALSPANPVAFTVLGDQVRLLPTPGSAVFVRFTYFIRPNRLVVPQLGLPSGDPDRGRVTNKTATTITVNTVPFDRNTGAAITSGSTTIDVIHPNGWHELALVSAVQTLAGNVFTITDGQTLDEIEVGDYVRAAGQTDWPALPEDFHRALADVAAVKILVELAQPEKSATLQDSVSSDITRFRSFITPRVKTEPPVVPVLLSGGGWSRWRT